VTVVVWIFALLTAVVHITVFVMESLLFERPGVHLGVFAVPTRDVRPVKLWAFNVGFYNLFIGCGLVVGVIAWITGNNIVGQTLVIYLCIFTFLAGIVLFVSDRLGLSRPRGPGVIGALGQSIPPLIALTAALL
jgi:putative membrane protein